MQPLRFILASTVWASALVASRLLAPRRKANWVEVKPVFLRLPRLAPAFDGYRLVQISDFHIGTWLDRPRLAEAVEIVNTLQPDLIAITGDFVTFHPERYTLDLVETLRRLHARDGVVAILGNHDHWTNSSLLRQVIRSSGAQDLSNRVRVIQRGHDYLHIAGVDDFMVGLDDLESVLSRLPAEGRPGSGAAILLAHEPDFADLSAPTRRFDLQISGHTHGGQILLPYLSALFLPRFGRKYPSGLYRVEEMWQYTNRGLGTAEIQFRLNCPAEITVFHLKSGCREDSPPV